MQIHLDLHYQNGERQRVACALPLSVGKGTENQLVLSGWRVAKQHARVFQEGQAVYLEDFGSLHGTFVNDKRVSRYGPLQEGDQIVIGPCLLQVQQLERPAVAPSLEMQSLPVKAAPHLQVPLALQLRLHQQLVAALDLRRKEIEELSDQDLRDQAQRHLEQILQQETLDGQIDQKDLLRTVIDEAIGLGPLERLLEQSDVSEIMVNGHQHIYIERHGRCELSPYVFSSESALLAVIDRIVSPLGRRIDDSSPMVDARLKDGSRVNAVIAPIALAGPCLTIRKFSRKRLNLDDLLGFSALSPAMASFLKACVLHKKNILVAGGTGSGKTTLLNILSNYIPAEERVITIEDAAELQLEQGNLVSLEARPANSEGKGLISIRDLVRNALRMRPDRIVVGECRGAEAFDMLAAMNTGHEGSLTTLHANSPRDALARLETLILMAGMDLPLGAVREHIASAIQVIVQQARLRDGRRVISSISEITGIESGRIQTQDLFGLQSNEMGFQAKGLFPHCFAEQPYLVDSSWFEQEGQRLCG